MFSTSQSETAFNLLTEVGLHADELRGSLKLLSDTESRYIRDLKINVSNTLGSENLSRKEAYLIGVAVAVNERNAVLKNAFESLAQDNGATQAEIAEAIACTSLLNANNVLYRFRHFTEKESYESLPAGIKMNIMGNPVLGKEFFELLSLVISALNGCARCVKAHEEGLVKQGTAPQRIWDAVRLGSVLKSLVVLL
ncbi:carboxymuconolactone decarboxylase family protein [Compostibacter hankyongensis]|uniref:Alkyl hydroperoxide reductase AhpD n=1 Tax=Compostibacter hankyongensis TaxID=1007089 RepID=A0ABP8FP47_9BACT